MTAGMTMETYAKLSPGGRRDLVKWLKEEAEIEKCIKFEKVGISRYIFTYISGPVTSNNIYELERTTINKQVTEIPPVVYQLD